MSVQKCSGLWSVVFLKTTSRATAVTTWEKGYREVKSLEDNTPAGGVYAGEFPYVLPEGDDPESERRTRGFFMIAAQAAQKIGIKGHGGFSFYICEKARLLEVVPL